MTIPEAEFLRRQLEARAAIERELLAELDLGRLLQLVVDHAARLAGAEGAIYLLTGDRLWLAARTGAEVLETPIAVGGGVTGECAAQAEGLIVNDYAAWPHALPDSVARGVRRVMAEPLGLAGGLLGVITLSRRGDDARPFGPDAAPAARDPDAAGRLRRPRRPRGGRLRPRGAAGARRPDLRALRHDPAGGRGHGAGTALCHRSVTALGGTIRVTRSASGGAVFTVELLAAER
jgi:hypothetical protein